MDNGKSKYERVTGFLKKSKPEMGDAGLFSERVIRRLQERKSGSGFAESVYEFLFGWVYIGWVRKSMVMVSMVLVVFFGYQQAVIMKRINRLSEQEQVNGGGTMTGLSGEITNKMLLYKYLGSGLPEGNANVSEKDIKKFIRSLNNMKERYKDVFKMIENDPDLKKYVEDKLKENESEKPKI